MLIGAAGETIWHVNRAAVACGRDGAPIAAATAIAGAAVANATDDPLTRTLGFKPFVLVTIPYDWHSYTGGEVLGVSDNVSDQDGSTNNAIAVGFLNEVNTTPAVPWPFMFAAATDTTTMLNMDNGSEEFDYGQATAITPDGSRIVGWAHEVSGNIQAVTWDRSNSYLIDKALSPSSASRWNATEDGGTVAGAYTVSSQYQSIAHDGSNPVYPESDKGGEATGINSNGRVCGAYFEANPTPYTQAYVWNSLSGNFDLHPTFADSGLSSGANCINETHDIGGWIENSEYSGIHMPTHWSPVGFPYLDYQDSTWGTGSGTSAEVVAINAHREMLINRDDGTPGVAIWTHRGAINQAYAIDESSHVTMPKHLVLMPHTDDVLGDGRCLNDDLWIGGSYLVHEEGGPQPCLVIPYDLNNDGNPDFREIIDSGTDGGTQFQKDEGGYAWLLDECENVPPTAGGDGNMRVGLSLPGYTDTETVDIPDTQIARLQIGINNPDYETETIGDGDFYVNGIMAPSASQCGPFETGINHWSQIDEDSSREIILMLRSNLVDTDPDHDYLPDTSHVDLGDGVTKDDLLTNLHAFAYKFCRCIDWMQLGNESFSTTDDTDAYFGDGGYLIYPNQSGCGGGSNPHDFEDLATGGIGCVTTAQAAVQYWHYEQLWAILRGSALAGRPLRFIGPGITSQAVLDGYDQGSSDAHWEEIEATTNWCNDYQVWFDVHDRYKSVTDGEATINDLGAGSTHVWTGQMHLVCLELAPQVDKGPNTWWTGGASALFDEYFGIPDCNQNLDDWSDYVEDPQDGWQHGQFNPGGFDLYDVASPMYYANHGNLASAFTVICYGSTRQHIQSEREPLFDLAALRAQSICEEYFTNNTAQFSPLKDLFETDLTDNFHITTFNPHPEGCDVCGN